jgi:tetratricopeptide (TPR) repeat protein
LLKTASQSSWRMAKQESASNKRVESSKKLTDAEYESLFLELLEGVHQGWSRGNIGSFLIAQNISEAELVACLHGFWERVLASSAVHDELAVRLVQLGETASGELGQVAESIGRHLLGRGRDVGFQEVERIETGEDENLGSQNAKEWFDRGIALKDLGNYEEALSCFDKSLQHKRDNYLVWNNRGILLCDFLGKHQEAIISFEKTLEIQPDFYDALYNRGVALSKSGRYEEATSSYDRALLYKPDNYNAWYNQGNALKNLGRYEEAIASYERSLQIQPDDYQAWNNLGLSLKNSGKYEQAIASFDKALLDVGRGLPLQLSSSSRRTII